MTNPPPSSAPQVEEADAAFKETVRSACKWLHNTQDWGEDDSSWENGKSLWDLFWRDYTAAILAATAAGRAESQEEITKLKKDIQEMSAYVLRENTRHIDMVGELHAKLEAAEAQLAECQKELELLRATLQPQQSNSSPDLRGDHRGNS